MSEFTITPDVLHFIIGVTSKHLRALNDELTDVWADDPAAADAACILALSSAIATTLYCFNNPGEVVDSLNIAMAQLHQPWRLVPVA